MWYAQRIAYFPLNICLGQENEYIFFKNLKWDITVLFKRCYFNAQRIAHFPLQIMWFGQENEHIFLNKVEWWLNRPRGMHTFFLNTTGGQENEHIFFTSLDLCGYKKMNTFSFVIENARQKLSVLFEKQISCMKLFERMLVWICIGQQSQNIQK